MGNPIGDMIKEKAAGIVTGTGAAGATIGNSVFGKVTTSPCAGGACGSGCGVACVWVGLGTAAGLSAYVWSKKRLAKPSAEPG